MRRSLHLNAFLLDAGHHEAARGTRQRPGAHLRRGLVRGIAQRAEAASSTRCSSPTSRRASRDAVLHRARPRAAHPLSAIAGATSRIGLSRGGVDELHPAVQPGAPVLLPRPHLRRASGLEHRHDVEQPRRAELRARCRRHRGALRARRGVLDVVTRLWDSWRTARSSPTRRVAASTTASGCAPRPRGPLLPGEGPGHRPRSAAGRTVYVQAGSSNDGRASPPARGGDPPAHQSLGDVEAFYGDIKARVAEPAPAGTRPRFWCCRHQPVRRGEQRAEAREPSRHLRPDDGPGVRPCPDRGVRGVVRSATSTSTSGARRGLRRRWACARQPAQPAPGRRQPGRARRPTLRQLLHKLAGGRGHRGRLPGTDPQVADTISNGSARCRRRLQPRCRRPYPGLFDIFLDRVVPILQDRGIFRSSRPGTTLRDD